MVETGVVSVELVDERGLPLSQDVSGRSKFLESAPPDQMKRWIHSKEPTAKFTLKVKRQWIAMSIDDDRSWRTLVRLGSV